MTTQPHNAASPAAYTVVTFDLNKLLFNLAVSIIGPGVLIIVAAFHQSIVQGERHAKDIENLTNTMASLKTDQALRDNQQELEIDKLETRLRNVERYPVSSKPSP